VLYRTVVVLIFATAAGALLASFPGPLFKDPAIVRTDRDLAEKDLDAQMVELRQLAHDAMVRLQSRQPAPSYSRVSRNTQALCRGGMDSCAFAKADIWQQSH
jgi:hypothetical protein